MEARPHSSFAGTRTLIAAITIASAGTLATAIGYASLRDEKRVHTVGTTRAGAVAPDRSAVEALLNRQARAVRTHDRTAFLAAVDPEQPGYEARQGELYDRLALLPITGWREEPEAAVASGGTTWRVTQRYRLAGFDQGDVTGTRYLTFTRRAGIGWVITGDGTGQGLADDAEIWDGGPVTVLRGRYSLVIGNAASRSGLAEIARRLDEAVPIVSGVVGTHWAGRVVALVPASAGQVESLIGGGQSLREIAALATVTRDPGGPAYGQDRIIIAPDTFAKLNALGRHVVLTHELTHVATGGAKDAVTPIWLIEGLADYVGYKDVQVAVGAAASELRAEVHNGQLPSHLPDRGDFAGTSGRLSQAYEESWLACRMVAERYGQDRLMQLYRAAGRESQDSALHDVLGLGTADFTTMWQAYLRRQLG
jgi:hypothetical protein